MAMNLMARMGHGGVGFLFAALVVMVVLMVFAAGQSAARDQGQG